MPMRVEVNSASHANGPTHAAKRRVRRTPRSTAPAARKAARKPNTYGRSRKGPISRSIRTSGVVPDRGCMLAFVLVTALHEAISRAQRYLLSLQAPDGHWIGELEADWALTAEALLLHHLIDRVDGNHQQRAVRFLRRRQNADGGWSLFAGGPSDLSATIKIYFAMKMAGVGVDDPVMAAARARIHAMGGPTRASVFTKILLAFFGEYDWNGVPTMPA